MDQLVAKRFVVEFTNGLVIEAKDEEADKFVQSNGLFRILPNALTELNRGKPPFKELPPIEIESLEGDIKPPYLSIAKSTWRVVQPAKEGL